MWSSLDPRMVCSTHFGWNALRTLRPSTRRVFLALVLPLSLIPVAMLLYAGRMHAQDLSPGSTLLQWQTAAFVFLLAELVSVPLMARLLRDVVGANRIDFKTCFALTAYASVPLWLSSLGLFSSDLLIVGLVAVLGLVAAFMSLFHGLAGCLGKELDTVVEQNNAYTVLSTGLCGWILMMAVLAAMLGIIHT